MNIFQEAPTGASLKDPIFNDFFNLTLTYRSSADISRPYGRFVDKFTQQTIDFSKVKMPEKIKITKNNTKKANDIAWIVSHCETNSHREKYVEKLKNNLNSSSLTLDIYGECGPLGAQSFTSWMAYLHQDINRVSSFSRCLNGIFPRRKCSIKALVS